MGQYSGMPDVLTDRALMRNRDPANIDTIDVSLSVASLELSEIQKAILKALREITLADEKIRKEQMGWIQYDRIPDLVFKYGHFGDNEDGHQSAVAESIRPLAEKKHVATAVPAWERNYGTRSVGEESRNLGTGATPFDNTHSPHYLRLTVKGHKIAQHLLDGDVIQPQQLLEETQESYDELIDAIAHNADLRDADNVAKAINEEMDEGLHTSPKPVVDEYFILCSYSDPSEQEAQKNYIDSNNPTEDERRYALARMAVFADVRDRL